VSEPQREVSFELLDMIIWQLWNEDIDLKNKFMAVEERRYRSEK
jgi:hypothetical protein